MKARDFIKNILYETEEKNFKLYYKLDIMIEEDLEKQKQREENPAPVQPEQQAPPPEIPPAAPQQVPQQQQTMAPTESTIYEDIYRDKSEGELIVSKDRVDNIQTLEDFIENLVENKNEGKPIINDLIAEIVLATAGVGTSALEDLVNKPDKIFIDLDYGENKGNSIGIRVNKTPGSSAISIAMKKNNNLIPGEFNIQEFNKQLVFLRNSLLGEKE